MDDVWDSCDACISIKAFSEVKIGSGYNITALSLSMKMAHISWWQYTLPEKEKMRQLNQQISNSTKKGRQLHWRIWILAKSAIQRTNNQFFSQLRYHKLPTLNINSKESTAIWISTQRADQGSHKTILPWKLQADWAGQERRKIYTR